MFTISKKQIEVFTKFTRLNFEKKAALHLRREFPDTTSTQSDKNLAETIQEGINEAAEFGVVERKDVLTYLEYFLCLGPNFAKKSNDEWIMRTLKIGNISGAEKMVRLQNTLPLKPSFH